MKLKSVGGGVEEKKNYNVQQTLASAVQEN
jgi:hypothetical protein